jgi:hypothetical protein
MHPLADMWTIHGPQRDPFPGLHYPEYQYRVWEAIHQNGHGCDYISESVLRQSAFEKGFLSYNTRKYHTLILLEVESVEPDTARALASFAATGGRLIFVAREPHQSPGWKDHPLRDRQVKETVEAMKRDYPQQVFAVKAPGDDLSAWFRDLRQQCGLTPYLEIETPSPFLSQIRHRADGRDFIFLVNYSATERITTRIRFPEAGGRKPHLWDAETGERYAFPLRKGETLTVDLYPATSQLIVFEKTTVGHTAPIVPAATGDGLTGWDVRLEHIDGRKQTLRMETPFDLGADPQTQSFAGRANYARRTDAAAGREYLDLGTVYGVSEVRVNGESLGCRWYGRHVYRLPEQAVRTGVKEIEVTVITTTGNYLKSSPDNAAGYRWTHRQPWQPAGLIGPVRLF